MIKSLQKLVTISLAISGFLIAYFPTYSQTVNIDLNTTHQVIRGYGGIHINSWQGTQLNADMQEKAFDNDPGEMGLSIFRMRIDPNPANWGVELPIAKYAKSKGAIVFASPWNPPNHMREVLRTTEHGTDHYLLPQYYADYVKHLNDFSAYMETNNVPLYAISVQNEPDWHSWTWWEPEQMLNFIKNHAGNINGRVIAPESLGYVRRMIDPLLNDPVANANIDILGTHLYGTRKENIYYPLAYEKNKEIWMTEHLYGSGSPEDNDWNLALHLADEINTTMDARMSTFVYWYIRRFYGLIDETGNITDKGYVMSQFSKFIPAGAMRVDVDNFKATPDVNVTAFKTDTSFVMVVVNNGYGTANLSINLEGSEFEKLTKFTTSETKKVVNDGETEISGGSFNISVDSRSITTFTTHPQQGGKHGNLPPVASAGSNLEFFDNVGAGQVAVTLKGSMSSDPDGEITNYSWARRIDPSDGKKFYWEQHGHQFASVADPSVMLEIGDHIFQLTVTDNDGARSTTIVNVSVKTTKSQNVWLEAECTEVGSNWDVHTGAGSSNLKYLMVKPGVEASSGPSPDQDDHLVYKFNITERGNFRIWARVLAASADDDSFWVRVDDGEWVNWNGIRVGSDWQWDDVHDASGNTILFPMELGEHTLTISYREDGAGLDKIYISNTGMRPNRLGSSAENCETLVSVDADLGNSFRVYPNPVKDKLFVLTTTPFTSIIIYDINGKLVGTSNFAQKTASAEIPLNLKSGLYMMRIITEKEPVNTRFVVE